MGVGLSAIDSTSPSKNRLFRKSTLWANPSLKRWRTLVKEPEKGGAATKIWGRTDSDSDSDSDSSYSCGLRTQQFLSKIHKNEIRLGIGMICARSWCGDSCDIHGCDNKTRILDWMFWKSSEWWKLILLDPWCAATLTLHVGTTPAELECNQLQGKWGMGNLIHSCVRMSSISTNSLRHDVGEWKVQ